MIRVTLRDRSANFRQYSHADLHRLDLLRNTTILVRSHSAETCNDMVEGPWGKCISSGTTSL
jgi:hypothetical protein